MQAITIKYWEEGVPATPDTVIKLTKGELYYIIRERLGLTLKNAALLIGISHVRLIRLEKSARDHKILREFYAKYVKTHRINIFK